MIERTGADNVLIYLAYHMQIEEQSLARLCRGGRLARLRPPAGEQPQRAGPRHGGLGRGDGALVAVGGADAMVGMIGLGVAEEGDLALITGSSHLDLGQTRDSPHRKGMFARSIQR